MALLRHSAVFLAAVCFLAVCHVSCDGAAAAGPRTTAATRLKKTQAATVKPEATNNSDRREEHAMIGIVKTYTCPQGYFRFGTTTSSPETVTCPVSGVQAITSSSTAGAACCPCPDHKTYTYSATCQATTASAVGQCCFSCGTSAGNLDLPASSAYKCPCAGGYGGGFYSTTVATPCSLCPANYFSDPNPGPTYNSGSVACQACAAGKYTNGATGQTQCQPITCASQFSYLKPAGTSPSDCLACDAASTDGVQTGNVFKCRCKPGYGNFNPSTGACTQCTSSQWSVGGDDALCGLCASTGTNGATPDRTACKCKVGYGAQALGYTNGQNFDCTACPSGSFSLGYPSGKVCSLCSVNVDNSPTHATGSLLSSASTGCFCDAGYGNFAVLTGADGNGAFTYGCSICAAGKFSAPGDSQTPSGVCTDCDIGTYNPTAGLSGSGSCQTCATATAAGASTCPGLCDPSPYGKCCPLGQKVVPGVGGAEATCTSCAPGEHTNGRQNGEATCSSCLPGTFSTAGTMSTGVCVQCSAGYASTDTTTECDVQANRCLATSGQYSAPGSAACSTCTGDNGYAVSSATDAGCKPCPPGQKVTSDHSGCEACALGTSASPSGDSVVGTAGNPKQSCPDCAVGYVAPFSTPDGALSCTQCASGTYASADSGSCAVCQAGTDTKGVAGLDFMPAGANPCTNCDAGKFKAAAGAASCGACPSGTVGVGSASPRIQCTSCAAGTYAVAADQACASCPDGYVSTGAANAACTPCGPGFFAASKDANCQACPTGFYSTGTANLVCTRCPDGYHLNTNAATYNSISLLGACTLCDAATPYAYQPADPTATPVSVCTACGVNQFFDSANGNACTQCEAGQQSVDQTTAVTGTRATACTTCPVGKTSVAGGPCMDCGLGLYGISLPATLNAGATAPNNLIGSCTSCTAGSVHSANQGSALACQQCNTDSQYAASSDQDCATCLDGYLDVSRTTCTACPVDYTRNVATGTGLANGCTPCTGNLASTGGAVPCALCPAGFQKDPTTKLCVACPAGTYRASQNDDHACVTCPIGTYSVGDAAGTSVCTACGNGQTWSAAITGGVSPTSYALACTNCPAGFIAVPDAVNGYTCTQCTALGTYAPLNSQLSSCLTCSDAGKYVPDSNADCVPCDDGYEFASNFLGTSANGVANACRACTGTYISTLGAACSLCPAGFEKATAGSCASCQAGHVRATQVDALCSLCPTGTYSLGDAAGTTQCTACGNGQTWSTAITGGVAPTSYAQACTNCPAGAIAVPDAVNGYSCTQCTTAGQYAPVNSQLSACLTCSDAGKFVPDTNDACEYCPDGSEFTASYDVTNSGTSANGVANACKPCTANKISTLGAQCALCPGGQQRLTAATCTDCGLGAFRPVGVDDTCQPCPVNKWCGLAETTTPTDCAPNSFSPLGSDSASDCTSCPVNWHLVTGTEPFVPAESFPIGSCQPCPAGYESLGGNTQCTLCGAGHAGFGATTGAGMGCQTCTVGAGVAHYAPFPTYAAPNRECLVCPRGSIVDASSEGTTCTPCDAGKYQASNVALTCTDCSAGSSTEDANGVGQTGAVASSPITDTNNPLYGKPTCAPCRAGRYAQTSGLGTCSPCQAGTWMPSTMTGANSFAQCQSCAAGRFSAGTGATATSSATACTPCDAGFFQGSTGADTCTAAANECPAGSFSGPAAIQCTTCPAGSGTPEAGTPNACYPCAPGRFSGFTGGTDPFITSTFLSTDAMTATTSLTLTADVRPSGVNDVGGTFTFKDGTANVAGCANLPGYDMQTCTISFTDLGVTSHSFTVVFTPTAGSLYGASTSNTITATVAGATVTADANPTASDPGKYASCAACGLGTFSSGTGNKVCTNCPLGRVANAEGSATCAPCGTNTFSNAAQGTTCTVCPVGTTTFTYGVSGTTYALIAPNDDSNTAPGASSCSACPTGWAREFAQASEKCGDCTVGKFAAGVGAICSSCPAGRFGVEKVLSSSTVVVSQCTSCPEGQYTSTIGLTECTQCPKGRSVIFDRLGPGLGSSICDVCGAGKFQSTLGQTKCTDCLAGTFSTQTERQTPCDACPVGTYSNLGEQACHPCGTNGFTNSISTATCTNCPAGTSSADISRTFCTPCAAGSYKDASFVSTNLDAPSQCKVCPSGTYEPNTGSQGCTQCPVGTFRTTVDGVTTAAQATACTQCPAGKAAKFTAPVATPGATTEAEACEQCPIGKYSATGADGSVTCTLCPAGRYASTPGLAICTACEEGRYGLVGDGTANNPADPLGQVAKDYVFPDDTAPFRLEADGTTKTYLYGACRRCPTGRASTVIGLTSTTNAGACTICLKGTYQDQTGQLRCAACALGRYAAIDGALTCTDCDAGKYAHQTGLTECFNCDIGKIQAATAQSGCVACADTPTGGYAARVGMTFCHGCFAGRYGSVDDTGFNVGLTSANFFTFGVAADSGDGGPIGCTPCPGGSYSINSTANSFSTVGLCNNYCATDNYVKSGGSACISCGGNHGLTPTPPLNGFDVCNGCPAGKWGPADGSLCTLCTASGYTSTALTARAATDCNVICDVGKYWVAATATCSDCPVNTWQTAQGQPAGTTPAPLCPYCTANTDRALGVTGCQPCTNNMVSDGAGGSCGYCSTPGQGVVPGTTTCVTCYDATTNPTRILVSATGTCELCPAGQEFATSTSCSYCAAGKSRASATDPAQCALCTGDSYTPSTGGTNAGDGGATGFTSCSGTCAAGSIPNAAHTGCQQCGVGTAETTAGTCSPCTGMDWAGLGASSCSTCPAGYVPNSDRSGCDACSAGKYRGAADAACTACPAGTWYYNTANGLPSSPLNAEQSPAVGVASCPACTTGTIRALATDGACTPCTAGSFPNAANKPTDGTAASTQCVQCTGGQQTNTAATACEACPQGQFRKYNVPSDTGSCQLCATDATTDDPFATDVNNQVGASVCYCKRGYTRTAADVTAADYSGAQCKANPCVEGQYLPLTGTGAGMCTPCPMNTFCNNPLGCGDQCMPCNSAHAFSAEGAAQCRCRNDGSSYASPLAGPFGYIPLGSGDQPGLVADADLTTGNVDDGAACLPACNPGQFFVTQPGETAIVDGTGNPTTLAPYMCYNVPAGTFCPAFMTYGCAGATVASALDTCQPNSNSAIGATKCTCAANYVDLDGLADGSGCVLASYVQRR